MAVMQKKNFNQHADLQTRFWAKVNQKSRTECWEWIGSIDKDGYGSLFSNSKRFRAHRVAWAIKHGEIPNGLSVLHKCDNTKCVNHNHLFLGTQGDNVSDMIKKGRGSACRGEANPKAKLTDAQVREIRARHAIGGRRNGYRALAREFGVSHPVVYYVVQRKVWRHVV